MCVRRRDRSTCVIAFGSAQKFPFPFLKAVKAMKAMKARATMKAMPKAKPNAKPKLYKAFTGAVRLRRRVLEMKANDYKCGVLRCLSMSTEYESRSNKKKISDLFQHFL